MGWLDNRSVESSNVKLSNVFLSHGSLDDISGFICNGGTPLNFVISGGIDPADRYHPLYPILHMCVGQVPIIILHAENRYLETLISDIWWNKCADIPSTAPLWVCNNTNRRFEPFLNMTEMQIVSTCRSLASQLKYSVTPRFERVVLAHLTILRELNIPYSLSGLFYLCQFQDKGEFHDNVMALPCGEARARILWADLGADEINENSQFDLFRAVINNLAHDAEKSGWDPDNTVGSFNCLTSILSHAVFSLPVNELYSTLMLTYLSAELTILGNAPFLLLIDGVKIKDDNFLAYISSRTNGNRIGFVSENIVDQIGTNEDAFFRFAERINCFILFKHGTGRTAIALSEVIGKFDYNKIESSQGTSRGFLQIAPRDRHKDVRYSVENRYRVMPEEFTRLESGQAIIFNTQSDQIVHYNR